MTRLELNEMKELSQKAFGTTSRWYKVLNSGKKVSTTVSDPLTGKQSFHKVITQFTIETLKSYMNELIDLRQKFEKDKKKKQLASIEFVEPVLKLEENKEG